MKEYLTIKEYATLYGLSEQAVYKQVRSGKLTVVERQESGKRKKYIFHERAAESETVSDSDTAPRIPAQDDDAAVRLPDHPDHRHTRQNERSSPPPEIEVLEKAIEALTAQLKEKDKQIETLTTLLYREQELQAHSHKLLDVSAEEKPPESPVYEEYEETKSKPKEEPKHGFLYWLFH